MSSTVIRSFKYHRASHSLDVEFLSGRRYRYRGVPESTVEDFRQAFSKGRFFNAEIRDHYPYVEMTPELEDWSREWA